MKQARDMTDAEIIAAIDGDPRISHITAAARRDPATINRNPDVDPRSYEAALSSHEARVAYMATMPQSRGAFTMLKDALTANRDG